MKHLLITIFLLLPILLFAQDATHICSTSKIKHLTKLNKLSKIQYPGDDSYDVTYYKLNLKIFPGTRKIDGIVTIEAKSLTDNLQNVFFDLQDHFNLDSVKSNGTVLSANLTNDKVNITLDKQYAIGEKFSVDIYYNGTPGSSGFGSFEFSAQGGSQAIWSLS